MKPLLSLSVFSFLNVAFAFGQMGTFQKNYYWSNWGPEPFFMLQIMQTGNGGYFIGAGQGDGYFLFIETNNLGDTIRTKRYYINNIVYTGIYSMALTPDSGFIVCGTKGILNNPPTAEVLLLKIDSSGNIQWAKTIGGASDYYEYAVKACSDSGYIITGSTKSYGAGNEDVYLIRLNQQGNLLWTKTFGGTNQDVGNTVLQTNDGGFLIGGSTGSFSPGGALLIKTDSIGNLLWAKTYGTIATFASLKQTVDSNFVILTENGVCKVDKNGNFLWGKNIGSSPASINITNDGGLIWSEPGGELVKMDSLGNGQWRRELYSYNSNCQTMFYRPCDVIETSDSGYAYIRISDYVTCASIVLVKLNSTGAGGCGNTLWGPPGTSSFTTAVTAIPSLSVSSGGNVSNTNVNISASGINIDSSCSMTDIIEIQSENDFIIYPNPFKTEAKILVRNSKFNSYEFNLYDVFGRLVLNKKLESKNSKLERNNLSSGIYFYQIVNEKEIIKTGKIVIQ